VPTEPLLIEQQSRVGTHLKVNLKKKSQRCADGASSYRTTKPRRHTSESKSQMKSHPFEEADRILSASFVVLSDRVKGVPTWLFFLIREAPSAHLLCCNLENPD
jgi:hypothetical protein